MVAHPPQCEKHPIDDRRFPAAKQIAERLEVRGEPWKSQKRQQHQATGGVFGKTLLNANRKKLHARAGSTPRLDLSIATRQIAPPTSAQYSG